MKAAPLFTLLSVSAMLLATVPLVAQEPDAAPSAATALAVGLPPNGSAAMAGDRTNPVAAAKPVPMAVLRAQWMGRLDSKSAKPGDAVELRTQEKTKTPDGTDVPKGTRILGHVISVAAAAKGSSEDAHVAIQLDRAELQGGRSLTIRSAILSVTPPPDPSTSSMLRNMDNTGMGGAMDVMGGAPNGGLGTGTNDGLAIINGRQMAVPKVQPGMGSAMNYGLQAPGSASPQQARGHEVTAVGAAANMAHPTGVSGVLLALDATGALAGTFSAVHQNVHLDGGTRVLLGIAIVK